MLQGIKCIVKGADHIAKNKVCQDAVGVYYNANYALAVVADGHGSEKYIRSEIGSNFAVESVRETIDAYMSDFTKFSRAIKENQDYICTKIQEQFLTRWFTKIEDYQDTYPLTESEKKILEEEKVLNRDFASYYGSTVLFAVMTEEYHFGMLVGDGGFIVINKDGSVNSVIEDENSFANYCSSICSKNSITAFQKYFEYGKPISITVSTDGLIKSFASEDDFEDYHLLLASMLDDVEACSASLKKNLNNRTHSGSGDDISLAVIFDSELVRSQKEIIKKCVQQGERRRKELAEMQKKLKDEQTRKMAEQQEQKLERQRTEYEEEIEKLKLSSLYGSVNQPHRQPDCRYDNNDSILADIQHELGKQIIDILDEVAEDALEIGSTILDKSQNLIRELKEKNTEEN